MFQNRVYHLLWYEFPSLVVMEIHNTTRAREGMSHILKFIDGKKCKVAGWGELDNGDYPQILREVQVPIRNTKKCEKDYRILSSATFDHKSF